MVRDGKKEKKAYKSAVRGKLSLKSGKFKKSTKKKKIKKKKDKIRDIEDTGSKGKEEKNDAENTEQIEQKENQETTSKVKGFKSDYEKALEEMTPSERAFLDRQKKNESYHIKQQSMKTHRQRIEQYNTNLSNLSEHHDIPKVGPG